MLSDFLYNLKQYGLEYFNRYYSCYRGIVVNNADPDNRGRLQIRVESIHGKQSPDYWALSKGMPSGKLMGFVILPNIGDTVWVSFEGGNVRFPVWEHGWFVSNTLPKDAGPKNTVLQSADGHRVELNDKDKSIRVIHKNGFTLTVNDKGLFVGTDTENLFKLLDDVFQAFENTKTATMLGPQPFINVAEYMAIRIRLKNILNATK